MKIYGSLDEGICKSNVGVKTQIIDNILTNSRNSIKLQLDNILTNGGKFLWIYTERYF